MKLIIIAIFNIILFLPTYCQVSWFPVGAKWHYQFSSMEGGGLTTLEVLSEDTLIGNQTFKKIISKTLVGSDPVSLDTFTEVLYVFEENKVVVGYDKYFGTTLLYDFNASVGDTLGMYFGGLSPAPFIVDSIGILDMNGSQLAFQDIRFPNLFEPGEFFEMRVIEGMGSINSHLFHDHTIIQPFDFPFYHFRCYEDSNVGLVNLSYNQADCDYVAGVTSIAETMKVKVSVYPNPSNDEIQIGLGNKIIDEIELFDFKGIKLNSYQTSPINISDLDNGIYFIRVIDSNRESYMAKVLKTGS